MSGLLVLLFILLFLYLFLAPNKLKESETQLPSIWDKKIDSIGAEDQKE